MRKLAAAAVIILGLAAVMGAGRGGTYQGGSYARAGATYVAGGVSATWDTVRVMLVMDSSGGFTHYRSEYAAFKTTANYVYQLGADDTTFAYAVVDTATSGGKGYWYNEANNDNRLYLIASGSGTGVGINWSLTRDTSSEGIPGPRPLLLHFNPMVPAGATIVSARMRCEFHTGGYGVWTTPDTCTATLMDKASDNLWYHYTSIYDGASYAASTDRAANMAKCNYNNQVYAAGATGQNGYSGATLGQWTPALKNRTYYYDWGSVTDWSGRAARATNDSTLFDVDMTDCVQAIANGATNNGIVVYMEKNDMWDHSMALMQFEPRAGGKVYAGSAYAPNTLLTRHTPWIEITYLTKRYQSPFPGGKTWAFVFQTDDGRVTYNDNLVSLFQAHSGKYTIYESRPHLYSGAGANATKMISWFDAGMEVTSHGGNHKITLPTIEIAPFAANDTVTFSASWDSVKVHMNKAWMDSVATANSRTDLISSRRWNKSMAMPGNVWGPWYLFRASQLGWASMRVGDMGDDGAIALDGLNHTYGGAAVTDTARAGVDSRVGRMPRNMVLLPTTIPVESVCGHKDSLNVTEAQVRLSARRIINKVKGQDRGVLSIYSHDTKTSGYPSAVADVDELGWLLNEVDAQGGYYMTATEYADWIKSGSTAVATPSAYGQPSYFEFPASAKVWYKPNGVGNRWIRGVK